MTESGKPLAKAPGVKFLRMDGDRAVPAGVHGILMRVASMEDTLRGKIEAWRDPQRRASKRHKDLADIMRLLEAHPKLRRLIPDDVRSKLEAV